MHCCFSAFFYWMLKIGSFFFSLFKSSIKHTNYRFFFSRTRIKKNWFRTEDLLNFPEVSIKSHSHNIRLLFKNLFQKLRITFSCVLSVNGCGFLFLRLQVQWGTLLKFSEVFLTHQQVLESFLRHIKLIWDSFLREWLAFGGGWKVISINEIFGEGNKFSFRAENWHERSWFSWFFSDFTSLKC